MTGYRNKTGLIFLICISMLFTLFVSSCSGGDKKSESSVAEKKTDSMNKSDTESTGTDSTQVMESTAEEASSETEGNIEDSIFYEFEEQVIYDKDGIKLTAIPEKDRNNEFDENEYGIEIKTENNSGKNLTLLARGIVLSDGYIMPFVQVGYKINNEKSYPLPLKFYNDMSLSSGKGSFTNYKDYGLGEKIGDFKILYIVSDAETDELIKEFETEPVKTKPSGKPSDYSLVKGKPLVFDQNGIKLYQVDNVIVNSNHNLKELEEHYKTVFFYENSTDNDYEIEYHYPEINSERMNTTQLERRFKLYKNRKGFTYADVRLGGLRVKGISNLDKLTVNISLKNLTDPQDATFESDPVTFEYPDPWKIIDPEKKE